VDVFCREELLCRFLVWLKDVEVRPVSVEDVDADVSAEDSLLLALKKMQFSKNRGGACGTHAYFFREVPSPETLLLFWFLFACVGSPTELGKTGEELQETKLRHAEFPGSLLLSKVLIGLESPRWYGLKHKSFIFWDPMKNSWEFMVQHKKLPQTCALNSLLLNHFTSRQWVVVATPYQWCSPHTNFGLRINDMEVFSVPSYEQERHWLCSLNAAPQSQILHKGRSLLWDTSPQLPIQKMWSLLVAGCNNKFGGENQLWSMLTHSKFGRIYMLSDVLTFISSYLLPYSTL